MTRLAKADAFRSLEMDRRTALWETLGEDQAELPLFSGRELQIENCKLKIDNCEASKPQPAEAICNLQFAICNLQSPPLPKMSPAEEVLADYRTTGLSLRAHPFEFLREALAARGIAPAQALTSLPNGSTVQVAGIVLVRQRPGTAKGITFVTLEDETGTANLIIRMAVWKRYRSAAISATLLLAHGRLQRQDGVIHVLTTSLEDLSPLLETLGSQSRDFQ
jgi:error-prone DNA polymerase